MFDTLKRFRTLAIFGIFLLTGAAFVIGGRNAEQGTHGIIGSTVYQGTATVENASSYALGGLGTVWDDYLDLVAVRRENERIRAELDRVRDQQTRLLGVMQENARLRAMVGFAEAHPQLDLVAAKVIAKDLSPFFRVVSIRLQVRDARVAPGMPVVSSAGVVGHISEVAAGFAEVTLAVDPRSSIDVLVQHNRARGVLQGLGHSDDYRARIAYLLRRDQARVGDVVVTSGMGGRFPAELVVGRVAEVNEQTYGLFQEVEVEPAVDFSRLEEVFVIVGTE